ncbi:hypothetical protein MICRO11B_290071 [Micrococcus luteus]|nr:hypothetical protein MICRO11B_290071 [Micrococcus luteus]
MLAFRPMTLGRVTDVRESSVPGGSGAAGRGGHGEVPGPRAEAVNFAVPRSGHLVHRSCPQMWRVWTTVWIGVYQAV